MYGITTAAEALQAAEDTHAKATVHNAAENGIRVAQLLGYANALGCWEKTTEALALAKTEFGWDARELLTNEMMELLDLATRDADDKWSGRGNDARRAYHDGRQEAVREIKYRLQAKAEKIYA